MRAAAMRRRPWSTRGPPVDFGSGDQCPRGAECLARFRRYSKNASNTISTPIVMTIFALKSHSKCQPQAFIHPPSISAIGAASVRLQLAFGSRFLADLGLNGSATETARCKYHSECAREEHTHFGPSVTLAASRPRLCQSRGRDAPDWQARTTGFRCNICEVGVPGLRPPRTTSRVDSEGLLGR